MERENVLDRDMAAFQPDNPEPEQAPQSKIKVEILTTENLVRAMLVIISFGIALWILYKLQTFLILLIVAIFFAYLITPIVEMIRVALRLTNTRFFRGVVVASVYGVVFGLIGLSGFLILPRLGEQVSSLAASAPNYLTDIRARTRGVHQLYEKYHIPPNTQQSLDTLISHSVDAAERFTNEKLDNLSAAISYLPWILLIPILAFFFIKDADVFQRSALKLLPRGTLRYRIRVFFLDVNELLAAYVRAQMIASLFVGLICWAGFLMLGVPYSLILGLFAAVMEFLPIVGPLSVMAIAGILASFISPTSMLAVILFLLILRGFQDLVVYPRLIGRGIDLHPAAVILSILAGAELGGVAGVFLAIPIIAVGTIAFKHWFGMHDQDGPVPPLPGQPQA